MLRFLALCLAILPVNIFSQSRLDSRSFIQRQAANYQAPQKGNLPDYRPPWIDKIEFRTETRDFMFEQQEYLLRLSPVSGGIRTAQKELHQHWLSRPDTRTDMARQERVYQWNEDWLDLYLIEQEKAFLIQEADLLADRQIIYDNALNSLQFEASELIEHEENISKHKWQTRQASLRFDQLEDIYQLQDQALDFESMPTADQIQEWLMDNPVTTEIVDPFAYEGDLIEKEIELERAEDRRWLDFVQLRYQGPHQDLLTERIALSMGINIPAPGSDKIKIEELKIEQAELKYRSVLAEEDRQLRSLTKRRALILSLDTYRELESIVVEERNRLERLFSTLSTNADQDPSTLLDIRQRQLELDQQLLEHTGMYLDALLEYRWTRGDFLSTNFINVWQL